MRLTVALSACLFSSPVVGQDLDECVLNVSYALRTITLVSGYDDPVNQLNAFKQYAAAIDLNEVDQAGQWLMRDLFSGTLDRRLREIPVEFPMLRACEKHETPQCQTHFIEAVNEYAGSCEFLDVKAQVCADIKGAGVASGICE